MLVTRRNIFWSTNIFRALVACFDLMKSLLSTWGHVVESVLYVYLLSMLVLTDELLFLAAVFISFCFTYHITSMYLMHINVSVYQ